MGTEIWDIGVDLEDHSKFHRFHPDSYPYFYSRVFTKRELEYCDWNISKLAGIFAAKEAIFKAVSGIGKTFLSQYEIDHKPDGKPVVIDRWYSEVPHNHLKIGKKKVQVKISISHGKTQSIAYAMAKLGADLQ